MSKNDFLSQLSHKLRALPESEQRDALEYYEGYLSDAEDEAAAIRNLGSPGEVAATILSNYVSQKPMAYGSRKPERRSRLKTAHIAIIAIFALPVGLPLAVTAFGLIIGLFAIIFSVVIAGIALLIGGVVSLIYSPFALANDFWFGILTGGIGLISLGLGILVFKGSAKLISGFPAILRMIRRRGRYHDAGEPDTFHDSHKSRQSWAQNSNNIPRTSDVTEPSPSDQRTTFGDPQYANSMPLSSQELHDTPFEPMIAKRRVRTLRLAVTVIILGAVMFCSAWLSGARGGSISWNNGRFNIQVGGRRGEQTQMPILESFHSVYVRASYANIIIMPSSTARVSYTNTPNVSIGINDGVLTINQNTVGTRTLYLMDFSWGSREIRVYLPPDFYANGGDIDVRTTSGRIQVEGDFANLNATANSGRIEVSNNEGQARNINLRTTSGRIALQNIRHVDHLDAHATSGRIEVGNISSNVNAVNLRTTSGRISIESVPHVDELIAQATSGRITIDDVSWTYLNARATSGRVEVLRGHISTAPGQVSYTNLTATSGRVSMNVRNNRDDFRLGLSATSGSISVDGSRLGGRGLINMGSGENIINVRTTSGRIDVDFSR